MNAVPPAILQSLGRWFCKQCKKLWPVRWKLCRVCGQDQKGRTYVHPHTVEEPDTQTTPLTQPCPASLTPTPLDILKDDTATLLHIPRQARELVAMALAATLRHFVHSPSWESLQRLLAFPKIILAPLDRGGRSHWHVVSKTVQKRAQRYMDDTVEISWAQTRRKAKTPAPQLRTRQQHQNAESLQSKALLDRVESLVAQGAVSKACSLLSSDGIMDAKDPAVLEELRRLHPHEPTPPKLPQQARQWNFPTDNREKRNRLHCLLQCIRSFPTSSAPGPSGLRPDHVKDLLEDETSPGGAELLAALELYATWAAKGNIPETAAPFLAAAKLTPLRKKGQPPELDQCGNELEGTGRPDSVRPIASGEFLRRMTAKFLIKQEPMQEAIKELQPAQVGVGLSGATDLATHALQLAINCMHEREPSGNWSVLKIDIKNAFNTANRHLMGHVVAELCPEMSAWYNTCYGQHSPVIVENNVILSQTGVQQGDPLGPAFFAMAIHPVISNLLQQHNLLWQIWYLDDGVLLGRIPDLSRALKSIRAKFASKGLQINLSKCELWGPGSSHTDTMNALPEDSPLRHITRKPYHTETGIVFLGNPISHPLTSGHYTGHVWKDKVNQLHKSMDLLRSLPDTQLQFTLLRFSMDACRVNHLLRGAHFDHSRPGAAETSKLIRSTLQGILGTAMTDSQWAQATLPIRHGGLGIRDPLALQPLARIASQCDFALRGRHVLCLQDSLPHFQQDHPSVIASLTKALPTTPEAAKLAVAADDFQFQQTKQAWWTEQAYKRWAAEQSTTGTARDRVRFHAQQTAHAGSWLAVIPSPGLRTKVDTTAWRCLLRWTLGIPLIPQSLAGKPCPRCQTPVDIFGDHVVCCIKNNIQRRHVALQDSLAQLVRDAGLTCSKEQGTGDGTRPGDLFIPRWDADGPAGIDTTVRCPSAPSHPLLNPERLQQWKETQEQDKHKKYDAACRRAGWIFHAFVMDTWGGLAPEATKVMTKLMPQILGNALDDHRRTKEASAWQRLSFPVMAQIGKQLAVMLSLPLLHPPEETGGSTPTHNPYA